MSNVIEVKKSPLGGKGVFATTYIRKGSRIGRWVGELTNRNEGRYLIYLEFLKYEGVYEGRGRLRFLNHADKPNSDFKGFELFATRPIHKGEEITIDYGEDYSWRDGQKMVK